MPVAAGGGGGSGGSCFDRVKMGFMMGMGVGMASGLLLGGFSGLRYGLRGRELVGQVGQVMLQGGGSFGTFMSITVFIFSFVCSSQSRLYNMYVFLLLCLS